MCRCERWEVEKESIVFVAAKSLRCMNLNIFISISIGSVPIVESIWSGRMGILIRR